MVTFTRGFSAVDVFPSLKVPANIVGLYSKFKMLQRKNDKILDSILNDHQTTRDQSSGNKDNTSGREDILDALLGLRTTNEFGLNLTDREIKGIIVVCVLQSMLASLSNISSINVDIEWLIIVAGLICCREHHYVNASRMGDGRINPKSQSDGQGTS